MMTIQLYDFCSSVMTFSIRRYTRRYLFLVIIAAWLTITLLLSSQSFKGQGSKILLLSNAFNFGSSPKVMMDSYCQCRWAYSQKSVPIQQRSTCSDAATYRGPGQRILSFAFYGEGGDDNGYFRGILHNLDAIKRIYPGYIMRLYTSINPGEPGHEQLCDLTCSPTNPIDICPVGDTNAPPFEMQTDMGDNFGMLWRFAPMADPLVKEWHSRDLDSIVSEREVAAVRDWLTTTFTFQIMRDNPNHAAQILGGAFGMQFIDDNPESKLRRSYRAMYADILKASRGVWLKGLDQSLLHKLLWENASVDSVSYDSYLCNVFNPSVGNRDPMHRAFPTQRENGPNFSEPAELNFVGSNGGKIMLPTNRPCPAVCRPKDHQDWTLC